MTIRKPLRLKVPKGILWHPTGKSMNVWQVFVWRETVIWNWLSTSKHAALFRVSDVFLLPCAPALFLSWCQKSEHFKQGVWTPCKPSQQKTMTCTFGEQKVITHTEEEKTLNYFVFQIFPVIKPHCFITWLSNSYPLTERRHPSMSNIEPDLNWTIKTHCYIPHWFGYEMPKVDVLYINPTVNSGQNLDVPLTSGKNIFLTSFVPTGCVLNGVIQSLMQMECSTYEQHNRRELRN